jgi:adenosylcobinamide-GDP ribazoletransferase
MLKSFLFALSFLTRLPVGKPDFAGVKLADCAWAFPVGGVLVGRGGGVAYLALLGFKIPAIIAAWLAIGFQVLLTGGLHEDGLADTADGLASGRSLTQKLLIMRDSQIGSYGVLTLIIILSLRACAIASFSGNLQVVGYFIIAGAASRAILPLLMRSLPSARNDGLAAMAGRPSAKQTIIALLIGFCSLCYVQPLLAALINGAILAIVFFVVRSLIRKNFGGITGDTLGAMQQITEVVILIFLTP